MANIDPANNLALQFILQMLNFFHGMSEHIISHSYIGKNWLKALVPLNTPLLKKILGLLCDRVRITKETFVVYQIHTIKQLKMIALCIKINKI